MNTFETHPWCAFQVYFDVDLCMDKIGDAMKVHGKDVFVVGSADNNATIEIKEQAHGVPFYM